MGGNGIRKAEIYSPPYLFKGARPTITSAPTSVAYGQSFFVETPDAAAISKVTMLRLSSVTHAFNMSQYIRQARPFELFAGHGRPQRRGSLRSRWLPLPLLRLPDTTCSSSSTEAEYRRSQRSSNSATLD